MADLPEGVEEVEEEEPAKPEELGDPAKFTWEEEPNVVDPDNV